MRRDLSGKHAFRPFSKRDFGFAARMFWGNGYSSADMIKDMDTRGRDIFLTQVRSDGRSVLADLRLTLTIFAWFAPGSLRGGCHPSHDEIAIAKRMGNWKLDLSALRGALGPDLDMTNISAHELERGRIARPP